MVCAVCAARLLRQRYCLERLGHLVAVSSRPSVLFVCCAVCADRLSCHLGRLLVCRIVCGVNAEWDGCMVGQRRRYLLASQRVCWVGCACWVSSMPPIFSVSGAVYAACWLSVRVWLRRCGDTMTALVCSPAHYTPLYTEHRPVSQHRVGGWGGLPWSHVRDRRNRDS